MTEEKAGEPVETASDIFNSISTYNRLYAFLHIGSKKPLQIADELGITRSALQYYLDDWKELDLISIEGNTYYYTGKGVETLTQIQEIVENQRD